MYLLLGSHDNVVALRGLCQHEGCMYLVLEYCPRWDGWLGGKQEVGWVAGWAGGDSWVSGWVGRRERVDVGPYRRRNAACGAALWFQIRAPNRSLGSTRPPARTLLLPCRGTLDVLLHHTAKGRWDPQKLLPMIRRRAAAEEGRAGALRVCRALPRASASPSVPWLQHHADHAVA